DILGIAQTGTGKTGAFTLPILNQLLENPEELNRARALILAPTRELCSQIQASVDQYAAGTNLRTCAIYGGVPQGPQVKAIREGVDLMVATPGRFLDLIKQKLLRLSEISVLVIDEADRMLDMGFMDE